MNRTFQLTIQVAGDVPKGVDPRSLYYDFGLDGKLRVYSDIMRMNSRVRVKLGSTAVTRVKTKFDS